MRKMSLAREIKINRLQNKNRMTGQTFNVGGHTSESLQQREIAEVKRIKELSPQDFDELKKGYNEIDRYKTENNIYISNSFEQNVFIRNFGSSN